MLEILTVLLTAFAPPERPVVLTSARFQANFAHAAESRSSFPPSVTRTAEKYRYVFVGGFLSERMPGYFATNAKELRGMGVPRKAIHFILPSSHETIEGNATEVRSKFEEIAASGDEKLVVIAHSKGACDVLAFALRNPVFVRDHVQALFLLQGPFGGTSIAEYLSGEGAEPDAAIPRRSRTVLNALGRIETYVLGKGKHGGLAGMTPDASRAFWEAHLKNHSDAIAVVGPKTYYVTSATAPSHLRFVQQAMGWYLQVEVGPNDGVVAIRDQSLRGLGTVVATLDAGHSDLTRTRTSSRDKRDYPRALTAAIVASLNDRGDVHEVKMEQGRRFNQKPRRSSAASSAR